ncbi:MAG: methylthioadenosine phosphorylase [Armatimonadetes bacterium]|jgi:5'-methylthioadenosine phosphorylase|nr:methylthioadenosine phosphorylase [Armatimonadota bacterium]
MASTRTTSPQAEIGVFGGSGFYSFLPDVEEVHVHTPYGPPSDRIALASIEGKRVAFLPRHGRDHSVPAHQVNYRANVWALKELGVREILAPCSCCSLQKHIHPGDFVILDQFIDRTKGRRDTFFDGPETHHIGAAEPYCSRLRDLAIRLTQEQGITVHERGTMVVIQGPRFSTRAESAWFTREGWDVVGMTQHPEAILARELGICYTGVALVTDYDTGIAQGREPVSIDEVFRVFKENVGKVQGLIRALLPHLGGERACECEEEARRAVVG